MLPNQDFFFRPDVSELETKLAEQSKILLNLQQKVDDLASKVSAPFSHLKGKFDPAVSLLLELPSNWDMFQIHYPDLHHFQ